MMPAKAITIGSTLSELLKGIVNNITDDEDCLLNNLCLDSRDVKPGDCFIALAGTKVHGLEYVEQAVKSGAIAVLWEQDGVHSPQLGLLDKYRDVTWIGVPNLSHRVGEIAERFFDSPSKEMNVIGVTGTNGKTSVSQFLAQALNEDHPCGVIGTIGNGMYGHLQQGTHTTPDAVTLHSLFDEFRAQGAWNTVMEVSSHGLDQGRVAGVNFDIAVFTNLSRDHLDYHGDMQTYADSKRVLFQMSSVKQAIINADDEFGRELIQALKGKINVISFGFGVSDSIPEPTLHATKLVQDFRGCHFQIKSPWGKARINTPLLGHFNVSNLLAVFASLMAMEVPFDQAVKRIEMCRTVAGRMERVDENAGNGFEKPMVVVDYAHTPDALEKALMALREHMPKAEDEEAGQGQLWCVFGCGGDRDRGKRPMMGEVAERLADKVIVTNDNPRGESPQAIADEILQGMKRPMRVSLLLDREIAIRKALTEASKDDVILIAGKGHEQYQIVAGNKLDYIGDANLVRKFFIKIELEDFHS